MHLASLAKDFRYSVRSLAKSPGFCAVAVVTLAVGIGANTAMFSVVNGMLLRPLPFPNAERIVHLWATHEARGWRGVPVSPLDFFDWREQNESFERLTAGRFWFYTLSGEGNPEQLHGMRVSPGFFRTLGVQTVLGRTFRPEEDQPGRDRVVILTHSLWQRRFNSAPGLIGKTVSIEAEPFTVVGILPPDFWFYPILGKTVEIWMPLSFDPSELNRDARSIMVHGLLKPGVSIEQARAEMASITSNLEQQYPKENKGWGAEVIRGLLSKEQIRPRILLLFAAVGLVLLIACANVANLTLARAFRRRQEIALRAALGAGRGTLIRQLLVESTVVAGLGCVAGLVTGVICMPLLTTLLSSRLRAFFYGGLETLRLDGMVLAFGIGAALFSALLLGLLPAVQASRTNLGAALKAGERGAGGGVRGQRVRNLLMACQVALAVTLSIGAGLMMRSLGELQRVDRGLNLSNVLTAQIWPPENKYVEPHQIVEFQRRILERLETLPGASWSSAISFLPLGEAGVGWGFTIEGRPDPAAEERPNAMYSVVAPGYFETMQIPLVRGRSLTAADGADAPAVAVIDQKLAERYWPGEDAVGKRFRFDPVDAESPWQASLTQEWVTVVGITTTVSGDGFWQDGAPVIYLPYQQNPSRMMHLVLRTERDPLRLANALRSTVWEIDPDQPVSFVRPMEEVPAWALSERQLTMQLLAVFAALAALLAAAGIYGVISYAVSQRVQEVGIRVALGAQRHQVAAMVVAQGLKPVLAGVVAGAVGAFGLTRFLSSQLYGVSPADPRTLAVSCLGLILVALLACYIPARRASRVDPITALRHE